METIVYNEIIDGRTAFVKEMDMPFGHYYTGYIEILSTDPLSWRDHLERGKEMFFDSYAEFEKFPSGVTFAGPLPRTDSGKKFVGFDTESFPAGEYDKEDCIDILKETATRLAIRTRAAKEAVANLKNEEDQPDEKPKNVGLLLETLTDIAKASTANKFYETDNAERYLNEAGEKIAQYLVKDLGVNPADIALYAMLKVVLDKDDDDE